MTIADIAGSIDLFYAHKHLNEKVRGPEVWREGQREERQKKEKEA